MLEGKNEFSKEKAFSCKRHKDPQRYKEKMYFRTLKRKSTHNMSELTCNKPEKDLSNQIRHRALCQGVLAHSQTNFRSNTSRTGSSIDP